MMNPAAARELSKTLCRLIAQPAMMTLIMMGERSAEELRPVAKAIGQRRTRGTATGRDRAPVVRALDLQLIVDALSAQVGPIIKQAFGRRTFWQANDAGDFNNLPAEKVRTQNAGRGDG